MNKNDIEDYVFKNNVDALLPYSRNMDDDLYEKISGNTRLIKILLGIYFYNYRL
jgi:hypothetical protein